MTKKTMYTPQTGWQVHLFVVQIAKNLAFVAYGYDPKVRSDIAHAGYYVEFDGVRVDAPGPIQTQLEVAGSEKLALVEIKLSHVSVPRYSHQGPGF
ncbi:hypothetical protein [Bradyrhizobium sp. B120]|uniref:hypothetical protein n=1 Tax=Bradyrhizobium sp. B120 TaxID=3410088 RepID=UPI003B981B72